jgi:hypothetical protein
VLKRVYTQENKSHHWKQTIVYYLF